jgi:DNA processing protein
MTKLYTISQIIKAHPLYSVQRDLIQQIYLKAACNSDVILSELQKHLPDLAEAIRKNAELIKKLEEENLELQMRGLQFVCYGDPLFPHSCYLMDDPPLTLSYFGSPAWMGQRTVSIVGSREPSSESLRWMEQELALFAESMSPCFVSGGARGIDQRAHALAIRKNNPTVVVVPSGLGQLYPSSLTEWIQPVLDKGGCFLSEYSHQQKMHKHLFHHRNRLIAALGLSTLIVEAKKRSGTMITAHQAAQLGRPVWVVPGHPQDPHFGGSLDLLMEGAQGVRDSQDLIMFFQAELLTLEQTLPLMGAGIDGLH